MSVSPDISGLLSLEGKTALVTGAAKGIGAEIAARFVAAGATVYLHYRSSADALEETLKRIQAEGGKAMPVQADLTVEAAVMAMMAGIEAERGALDILVNNAGIYPTAALLDMSPAEWQAMFDANVTTTVLTTQAAARGMKKHGGGSIVNIGSIAGNVPGPAHSHYNSAKAAVGMFTKSAAQELGPMGIRVNCVSPGLIHRPGLENDWPEGVASWQKRAPLSRVGQPVDVANACLFLASDATGWITGQELLVDGGMSVAPLY